MPRTEKYGVNIKDLQDFLACTLMGSKVKMKKTYPLLIVLFSVDYSFIFRLGIAAPIFICGGGGGWEGGNKIFKKCRPPWLGNEENVSPHSSVKVLK